tara:strand:- start:20557 stop:20994 length:438 start_codon:yes stop_codon:yes gene_type:complete
MTTPTDKDLRALALAATPGPWRAHNKDASKEEFWVDGPRCLNMHFDQEAAGFGFRDAAFIAAANPQTVIGLLDRIEAGKRERDKWMSLAGDLRSQLEEAKAALKPFVTEDTIRFLETTTMLDVRTVSIDVTVGDLRRAKAGGTDA